MMQSNITVEKLDYIVNVLTMLDDIRFVEASNSLIGILKNNFTSKFNEIRDKLELFDIDCSDSDERSYTLYIPLTSTNLYFDVNHYLKNDKRRLDPEPNSDFYIYDISERYNVGEETHAETIKKILLIANLFKSLTVISDTNGNSGNKSFIIFVGKRHLKINSEYTSIDLSVDVESIKRFLVNYIQNNLHKEDRHLAIRNALNEVYKETEVNFSVFLKFFDDFSKTVKSNFQLYMDKFSFDDFKNKVEEERREYTIKINKVFSDMQNQLLTLPIATLLAAGQLVLVNSIGDFIKNTFILLGIMIFCIFVIMQINNQKSTLSAIEHEIKIRNTEVKKKDDSDHRTEYLKIYSQLDSKISRLDGNLKLVETITKVVTCLVVIVYFVRFMF